MNTNLSRRQFFRRATTEVSARIGDAIVKNMDSVVSASSALDTRSDSDSGWVVIATQSEMSPGASKVVAVGNLRFTLRSDHEAIWAELEGGGRVALRMEAMGRIAAHPGIEWPSFRALSQSSGNEIDLVLQDNVSNREICHG